jgi:hypothetical protein
MYRSPCQHNMQCYYGIDGIPGHCTNHSICDARSDILYYNPPQQWKVGDDWRISIIAVLATGAIVIGVIVGRNQLAKLVKKVNAAIEKWQNPDTSVQPIPFENEEAWSRYHDSKWWKQMPGFKWVYSKLKRNDQGQYYQLNNRMDGVEEPPPYQQ